MKIKILMLVVATGFAQSVVAAEVRNTFDGITIVYVSEKFEADDGIPNLYEIPTHVKLSGTNYFSEWKMAHGTDAVCFQNPDMKGGAIEGLDWTANFCSGNKWSVIYTISKDGDIVRTSRHVISELGFRETFIDLQVLDEIWDLSSANRVETTVHLDSPKYGYTVFQHPDVRGSPDDVTADNGATCRFAGFGIGLRASNVGMAWMCVTTMAVGMQFVSLVVALLGFILLLCASNKGEAANKRLVVRPDLQQLCRQQLEFYQVEEALAVDHRSRFWLTREIDKLQRVLSTPVKD